MIDHEMLSGFNNFTLIATIVLCFFYLKKLIIYIKVNSFSSLNDTRAIGIHCAFKVLKQNVYF